MRAAAAGAVVLALNIAPTEEPIRLGQELGWIRLTLLVGASLLLPYPIVFEAEFGGKHDRRAHSGAAQHPSTETVLAYLVALRCPARCYGSSAASTQSTARRWPAS